jgi:hypothetical protein
LHCVTGIRSLISSFRRSARRSLTFVSFSLVLHSH